jgi:hypothetical protein
LNDNGTPNEYVAKLQSRLKDFQESGRVGGSIQNQQAVEGLSISLSPERGAFTVANSSDYFIDQVTFACEVDENGFVFFIWSVGAKGEYPNDQIEWLAPATNGRTFPDPAVPSDHLTLLHNDSTNDEVLNSTQVKWLVRSHRPTSCVALDGWDATEKPPSVLSPAATRK